MTTPKPSPYLSLRQMAAELGVSYETVRAWRKKGVMPHLVKLPNGQLRVHREDLDLWLEDQAT
jgi:excisionase family DNA binding protein